MSKLLRANLQVWHLLVFVVVMAFGTGGVVWAQGPGPQRGSENKIAPEKGEAFYPAGALRMVAASANNGLTVLEDSTEHEVISAQFTVPDGKRADIVGFFNGEGYKETSGYCYGEFHLDSIASNPLKPGEMWIADGYVYSGAYPTYSFQGFKKNVGPGTHTLYVTLEATNSTCYVYDRSLIVIANVR